MLQCVPLRWSKKSIRDGELHGKIINMVKRALGTLLVASKEDGISYCLVTVGFVEQNQNMKIISDLGKFKYFFNDPSV